MTIDFDSMPDTVLERFKGGEKEMRAKMYWDGTTRIMRATLIPGASIGLHRHEGSCEMIIIISGIGTIIEEGGESQLLPGQCHYCPEGQEHSLINKGETDLVFYGIVPKQ